jgi:phosphotransferase system HPr (HPr) family protein
MSKASSRNVIILSPQGLHLRPAGTLVELANQFQSQIHLKRGSVLADCKSIFDLMTLGAAQSTELTLIAKGDDAEQALDCLEDFFLRGFDEDLSEDDLPEDEQGNNAAEVRAE